MHVRLVPDPCRHVDYVAGVLTRLSPEGLRRRPLRVANSWGDSRRGAIASSSVMAVRRSTTPSCFGELTGVYSRRIPRSLSNATNSGLANSVLLSERMHSTMDGVPLALMSARRLAKAIGTSDLRFKKYGHPMSSHRQLSSSTAHRRQT